MSVASGFVDTTRGQEREEGRAKERAVVAVSQPSRRRSAARHLKGIIPRTVSISLRGQLTQNE